MHVCIQVRTTNFTESKFSQICFYPISPLQRCQKPGTLLTGGPVYHQDRSDQTETAAGLSQESHRNEGGGGNRVKE